MDDELEYLTWLAMRNEKIPNKRTLYYISDNFSIPASLYEDWMEQIAIEEYPNRYYHFARMLCSGESVPRIYAIPWTLELPKQVVPTCKAVLISETTEEEKMIYMEMKWKKVMQDTC